MHLETPVVLAELSADALRAFEDGCQSLNVERAARTHCGVRYAGSERVRRAEERIYGRRVHSAGLQTTSPRPLHGPYHLAITKRLAFSAPLLFAVTACTSGHAGAN